LSLQGSNGNGGLLLRKQAKPDITFNLVMSGFFLPNNPLAVDEWGCYRHAGKT